MCVVKQKESNDTTRGKDHQTGLRLQPRHSFSKQQQQQQPTVKRAER